MSEELTARERRMMSEIDELRGWLEVARDEIKAASAKWLQGAGEKASLALCCDRLGVEISRVRAERDELARRLQALREGPLMKLLESGMAFDEHEAVAEIARLLGVHSVAPETGVVFHHNASHLLEWMIPKVYPQGWALVVNHHMEAGDHAADVFRRRPAAEAIPVDHPLFAALEFVRAGSAVVYHTHSEAAAQAAWGLFLDRDLTTCWLWRDGVIVEENKRRPKEFDAAGNPIPQPWDHA